MSGGSDPYVYPGADTLINLADIRDPQELATFEVEATLRRNLELWDGPLQESSTRPTLNLPTDICFKMYTHGRVDSGQPFWPSRSSWVVPLRTSRRRTCLNRRPSASSARFIERWNDIYIATTTRGQIYSGRLVGRDQDAFMMRTVADQIIIGKQTDIPPETRTGDQLSFTAT
jgi:hypothetical protein